MTMAVAFSVVRHAPWTVGQSSLRWIAATMKAPKVPMPAASTGGAPPEKIEGIRHEFLESCETVLERGGRLIYRYAALLVCAVRP